MRTLRIAVLSDLHIDSRAEPDSWELAKAAFRTAADQKPHHVVIAGDLFDCSTAMEREIGKVRSHLKRIGLWHRDRLTIVVGNHDIFHTAHRGKMAHRVAEYAHAVTADAQDRYDTFCGWAGELAGDDDLLAGENLFPLRKRLGFVNLWAADTTGATTNRSSNGYWHKEFHKVMRNAVEDSDQRSVLAIHHPPYEDEELRYRHLARFETPLGFPTRHFNRLQRFTDHAKVDAILCGHIHAFGECDDDDPYSWAIGDKWRSEVYCVGRTGGVHDTDPTIGVLTIPEDVDKELEWEEIEVQ